MIQYVPLLWMMWRQLYIFHLCKNPPLRDVLWETNVSATLISRVISTMLNCCGKCTNWGCSGWGCPECCPYCAWRRDFDIDLERITLIGLHGCMCGDVIIVLHGLHELVCLHDPWLSLKSFEREIMIVVFSRTCPNYFYWIWCLSEKLVVKRQEIEIIHAAIYPRLRCLVP